jgi:hypothetical protein
MIATISPSTVMPSILPTPDEFASREVEQKAMTRHLASLSASQRAM